MELVPTSHGNDTLVYQGYIFLLAKRNKDGSLNWRCQNYWKKDLTHCKITCTTLGNEFIRGRAAPIVHNNEAGQLIHQPPTQEKKYAMKLAQDVAETVPISTKPLQQIWNKAVIQYVQTPGIDFTQFALAVPQFQNIRTKLFQIRREDMPLLPRSRETIDLDGQFILTLDGLRFLLFDTEGADRIIAFASDRQIEVLSQSEQWHADGTFKSAPELFAQNYLIHAWFREQMFPCVTILTPDRTKRTYKRVFQSIKQSTTLQFRPAKIMTDYEQGAISAFTEEFPNAQVKGCHFHFTQAIWRRIQELGLVTLYKENPEVRAWLGKFKSLAFVPLNLVENAFNYLISIQPHSPHVDKFNLFYNYIRTTWLDGSKFPPALWNHYETIGPRTNNHLEGYNFNINNEIDSNHPNIFSLINTLKELEVLKSMDYVRLIHGVYTKSYRRPEDIKRDEVLFNLKTLLFYNSISLSSYLSFTGRLFGYDKNVTYEYPSFEFPDIDSYLDEELPIDLNYLQGQSFDYIRNYVHLNRDQFIDLVKYFRRLNVTFYNNQQVDLDYYNLIELYSNQYFPLVTGPDGNCLYNAVSLNLCGIQNENFKLKLASIFITLEYETFYRYFILRKGYDFSFEDFILQTVRLGEWGNSLNILTLSLLTSRPIFCFQSAQSVQYNPFNSTLDPIVLFLNDDHYVAGLRLNHNARIATPLSNPLLNRFWDTSYNPIFRSYND